MPFEIRTDIATAAELRRQAKGSRAGVPPCAPWPWPTRPRARMRGQRPSGRGGRFPSVSVFAAVEPETGSAFGLGLPHISTEATTLFLAPFAATLEPDTDAVMVLDGAGWHPAAPPRAHSR